MVRLACLVALAGCWSSSAPPPAQPQPQPQPEEIVQPVKIEKVERETYPDGDPCGDPCADPCGGMVGGVVGGVPGGVVGGAPPPPPPPPPPGPSPQNVPPTLLEGNRIAGTKNIVPDDLTKVDIARTGKTKIVGSYKLCLTDTGDVAAVTQLKSTGFPKYDQKILTEMRTGWRYSPYFVNGKAVPVCTAVTFIYSQLAPPPPPPRP